MMRDWRRGHEQILAVFMWSGGYDIYINQGAEASNSLYKPLVSFKAGIITKFMRTGKIEFHFP